VSSRAPVSRDVWRLIESVAPRPERSLHSARPHARPAARCSAPAGKAVRPRVRSTRRAV